MDLCQAIRGGNVLESSYVAAVILGTHSKLMDSEIERVVDKYVNKQRTLDAEFDQAAPGCTGDLRRGSSRFFDAYEARSEDDFLKTTEELMTAVVFWEPLPPGVCSEALQSHTFRVLSRGDTRIAAIKRRRRNYPDVVFFVPKCVCSFPV